MLVGSPTLEIGDQAATLSARFEFARRREPFVARISIPATYSESIDQSSTPFVPLATLVAAHIGEDLRCEAPASPRLRVAAETASFLFADWWGYRPVTIEAPGPSAPPATGDGVGILFSRGVDTGATLVRSLTGVIPERVTHLLAGFDIEWAFTTEVQREIWKGNEELAAELGLPLVRMESNAKELLRGLVGWPRSFGAAYMAPALMLGPLFGTVITGSTQPVAQASPRGSRYDLDPLWSTEATTVRQDGYELDRLRRVGVVATSPAVLRALKVCWMGRGAGNCGRCEKCLRTMTALAWHGVDPGRWPPFDGELSAGAVLASEVVPGATSHLQWTEGLPAEMADIRDAWAEVRRKTVRLDAKAARGRGRADRRRRWRRARRRAIRKARRRLGSSS